MRFHHEASWFFSVSRLKCLRDTSAPKTFFFEVSLWAAIIHSTIVFKWLILFMWTVPGIITGVDHEIWIFTISATAHFEFVIDSLWMVSGVGYSLRDKCDIDIFKVCRKRRVLYCKLLWLTYWFEQQWSSWRYVVNTDQCVSSDGKFYRQKSANDDVVNSDVSTDHSVADNFSLDALIIWCCEAFYLSNRQVMVLIH